MTEAARLVDELTTLLYEVVKRWQLQDGRVCEIVVCGACRRKADKPESVVHESDCPVYRLIRAEEANTAVIRANAEEIADLEDVRDELEAQVNALTAQMECRNELTARIRALEVENERGQQAFADLTLASVERINALEAERDALRARAERAESALRHVYGYAAAIQRLTAFSQIGFRCSLIRETVSRALPDDEAKRLHAETEIILDEFMGRAALAAASEEK